MYHAPSSYRPGEEKRCAKCNGSGQYVWGACINGTFKHRGMCFACRGTGVQTREDSLRCMTYWNHYIPRTQS